MLRGTRFVIACVASALFATYAGATTVETSSFSSWKATLTASPTEANFSQLSYTSYDTSAGITLPGVNDSTNEFTFTGPDNGGFVLNGQRYNNILSLVGAADTNAGVNVAFSGSGQNAFLISVGSTSGTPLSIALSDGETFTLSSGVYGFTLSHPITWFFLSTASTSQVAINDFYYGFSSLTQDSSGGSTPAVAECSTMLLVFGGALTLLGAKRKLIPLIVEN